MKLDAINNRAFLSIATLLFLMLFQDAHACDRPVFIKSGSLEKVSRAGFRVDWAPGQDASYYTVSYLLKILEGRTLSQRESVADLPFYVLPQEQLQAAELLHLVVEVTAHCGKGRSEPSFAQFALKNAEFPCALDNASLTVKNRTLSWLPVPAAQAYLLCFFKPNAQASCREAPDFHHQSVPEGVRLISVAPVCNGTSGTPAFTAASNAMQENRGIAGLAD